MTQRSASQTIMAGAIGAGILFAIGFLLPNWMLFTATKAAGYGLVALGIVVLMRSGLVSFGQGLVYCIGAYTSGLIASRAGITDVFALLLIGGAASTLVGLIVAPLLARYRSIFFAMLTLALSMVLYGILVKQNWIGGSDGFNVPQPTFLGWAPELWTADMALYGVAVAICAVAATLCRFYFDSMPGLVAQAVRENELRVEYLGTSVFNITVRNFVIAAGLGGLGGTLNGLTLGHVDPLFSFWTTSGEFVFVAILAGHASVAAVFVASFLLELVRSFSNRYFPDTWQFMLGAFLLAVILFLPNGLGSIWEELRKRFGGRSEPAPKPGKLAESEDPAE